MAKVYPLKRKRPCKPAHNPFPFRNRALTLAYSEHLCATRGAYALGCRPSVLHGHAPSIPHFSFGSTFHTVCLHGSPPLLTKGKSLLL